MFKIFRVDLDTGKAAAMPTGDLPSEIEKRVKRMNCLVDRRDYDSIWLIQETTTGKLVIPT